MRNFKFVSITRLALMGTDFKTSSSQTSKWNTFTYYLSYLLLLSVECLISISCRNKKINTIYVINKIAPASRNRTLAPGKQTAEMRHPHNKSCLSYILTECLVQTSSNLYLLASFSCTFFSFLFNSTIFRISINFTYGGYMFGDDISLAFHK